MFNIPEGWKKTKVKDLGKIVTGKTPPTKNKENFGGDIPFLTPSDDMESRYVFETSRTISNTGIKILKNKILPKNSVCVSCIGSDLGKVVITSKNTVTNQQINSIIPSEKYNYLYIYYAMSILGRKINNLGKTSTAVPIINKSEFGNEVILVPPIEEQEAISKILGKLDDKIEVNNKIIENLEAQGQAIFKNWFIDFEPFQDGEFIDSELGKIPKGWRVNKLKNLVIRRNGYSYKSSELNNDSYINMITLKNFNRNGGINFNDTKPINKTERMKEFHFLDEGDILVACTDLTQEAEVLGRTISYFKNEDFKKEIISMDLVKIVPNLEEDRTFIYCYLNSDLFKNYSESIATGTTVLHLPKKGIDNFEIIYPTKDVIDKFTKLINPLLLLNKRLLEENKKLASIRDTLLPKLMSGEIRLIED